MSLTMSANTNTETEAAGLRIGDLLYDPAKSGTHGSRVDIEWMRPHLSRKRVYIAGVEERSKNPVQLAYDFTDIVKVFRE